MDIIKQLPEQTAERLNALIRNDLHTIRAEVDECLFAGAALQQALPRLRSILDRIEVNGRRLSLLVVG